MPPGKTPTKPEVLDVTSASAAAGADGVDIQGEEQSIAELIGRRNEKEDGVVPTPLAHAPHFIKVRSFICLSRDKERERGKKF